MGDKQYEAVFRVEPGLLGSLVEEKEIIVRCEDCKYADEPPEEDEGFVLCKKCSTWDTMFLTHPDDFCSWGEK